MPFGMPKIPFQLPDAEEPEWTDIEYALARQRVYFLFGELDFELSSTINGLIIFLDIEDCTKDQFMFINCPGGSARDGVTIFDLERRAGAQVHTICMGLAGSVAAFILLGGELSKRSAMPNARVMIRQPSIAYFKGQDYMVQLNLLTSLRNYMTDCFAEITGKPWWVVAEDLERETFMSPTEAQDYGIVDQIGFDWSLLQLQTGDPKKRDKTGKPRSPFLSFSDDEDDDYYYDDDHDDDYYYDDDDDDDHDDDDHDDDHDDDYYDDDYYD